MSILPTRILLATDGSEEAELAEEIGAGLIAMGSRGLGRIRRALMGSVSDNVIRHAHCPVLVVRAEKSWWHYLEGAVSTARRPRGEGAERKRSFWDVLFGPYPSEREVKVLEEYVIHRLGDGARLEDIVQEQYVRRYASPGRSKTSWTIPGSSRPSERRWKKTSKSWAGFLGHGEETSDRGHRLVVSNLLGVDEHTTS